MPCAIKGDESIPIAQFGTSNVGTHEDRVPARARPPLRPGDAGHLRRALQLFVPGALLAGAGRPARSATTAGQDFRSESYFALLRNYRRHGWIVLYLFGNSPAVCPSFLQGRKVDWLEELVPGSLYAPHATSLRMSDLGYRNKSQAGLNVSVNSLDHYVRDLTRRDQHAAPGVREDRREGGRRVPAAERQPAADRERVLQLHPPEARDAVRRAPDQGAAPRRRAVRRDALARRERVRSGGRQPEQAALPRGLRRLLRAGATARRSSRPSRPSSTAIMPSSRARAAGRA